MKGYENLIFFMLFSFAISGRIRFQNNVYTFSDDFIFGTSSSAYQTEGAWNVDGKGESIWDYFTHNYPRKILDRSTGDFADDSYYLYRKDIEILKTLNVNTYRFSISWPRVLPYANTSVINYSAIRYYQTIIQLLKEANIRPIICLYHWDLPNVLQKQYGGWENPIIADYFENYTRVIFENFADQVDWWVTFNEPQSFCSGYTGEINLAPNVNHHGYGEYRCINTVLLSHARAYHLYKNNYCRDSTKCKMGIVLLINWAEPKTSSPEDLQASYDYLDFQYGIFAHPIYSKEGDYPEVVKRRVDYNSRVIDGLNQSRLVPFTQEQIEQIRGTADLLCMNQYFAYYATPGQQGPEPSFSRDTGVIISTDPSWPRSASPVFLVTPWAIGNSLHYINTRYPGYDILITETGYAGFNTLDDVDRISYMVDYTRNALETQQKYNIPLIGILQWTALDDFEWSVGYSVRFGMVYVNYSDPARTRTLKRSALVFRDMAETHQILPFDSINTSTPFPLITF